VPRRGRDPRVDQFDEQRVEEERVASGVLVDRGDEGGLRRTGEAARDDVRDRLCPEWRGLQAHAARLGEDGVERARGRPRVVARGDHERDRRILEPRGEVREELQRGLVGPLGVVDRHQHRPRGRDVGEQPVEAVAHGVGVGVLRTLRGEPEGRRGMAGRARQQGGALGGRGPRHLPLEEAADHPERDIVLEL
jgi:hypothetical protein